MNLSLTDPKPWMFLAGSGVNLTFAVIWTFWEPNVGSGIKESSLLDFCYYPYLFLNVLNLAMNGGLLCGYIFRLLKVWQGKQAKPSSDFTMLGLLPLATFLILLGQYLKFQQALMAAAESSPY